MSKQCKWTIACAGMVLYAPRSRLSAEAWQGKQIVASTVTSEQSTTAMRKFAKKLLDIAGQGHRRQRAMIVLTTCTTGMTDGHLTRRPWWASLTPLHDALGFGSLCTLCRRAYVALHTHVDNHGHLCCKLGSTSSPTFTSRMCLNLTRKMDCPLRASIAFSIMSQQPLHQ